MKKQYVLGIDFGTLSVRALLIRVEDKTEVADATYTYPHGVMDEELPCGIKLPPQFALQHPEDYLEVLRTTIPEVLKKSGISALFFVVSRGKDRYNGNIRRKEKTYAAGRNAEKRRA